MADNTDEKEATIFFNLWYFTSYFLLNSKLIEQHYFKAKGWTNRRQCNDNASYKCGCITNQQPTKHYSASKQRTI